MQTRPAAMLLALVILAVLGTGCGALLRIGNGAGEGIVFENGELLSREPHALDELDAACRLAIEALGYDESEATREEGRILWQARTAGGDRVEIRLAARVPRKTDLFIRVGVLGDEARSRLLLEQIHQSL